MANDASIPAKSRQELETELSRLQGVVSPSVYREFREFLEAKRIKREPLRFKGKAMAEASFVPASHWHFSEFRERLRGVGDWGRASERFDALEHALVNRGSSLPLPRKVFQNDDMSITMMWEQVTVRCFVDGMHAMIGGAAGISLNHVTPELLDALAFQATLQANR